MLYFIVINPLPAVILTLTADDNNLLRIDFGAQRPANAIEKATPVLILAAQQLEEYFHGLRRDFTIPLKANGTQFQQQVWQALTHIPYGTTHTYKELAAAIGKPKASRAVGSACNRNPLPIVIPCHRVIGSSGSLTGYAGGLELKAMLLKMEENFIRK